MTISTVTEDDLGELLPLMRAYCDFYASSSTDDELLGMARALIADPEREGVQLVARDAEGHAVGFATLFWSWTTTDNGGRLATMNDLFVAPEARGGGIADTLIAECLERARAHGAVRLEWVTETTNARAQAVYDRVGGERTDRWVDYSLRP